MSKNRQVRCNHCGKIIQKESFFRADWEWDYFSGKDGERHSFSLCEMCYDEITGKFLLPVEVEEYL